MHAFEIWRASVYFSRWVSEWISSCDPWCCWCVLFGFCGTRKVMSMRKVSLEGGSPWGFRIHGGADVQQPLRISRVSQRTSSSKLLVCFYSSRLATNKKLFSWHLGTLGNFLIRFSKQRSLIFQSTLFKPPTNKNQPPVFRKQCHCLKFLTKTTYIV